MDDTVVEPEGAHEPHLQKTPRKAAVSAWIGSALEYYDFFIYGTAAALIFPAISATRSAARGSWSSPSSGWGRRPF